VGCRYRREARKDEREEGGRSLSLILWTVGTVGEGKTKRGKEERGRAKEERGPLASSLTSLIQPLSSISLFCLQQPLLHAAKP